MGKNISSIYFKEGENELPGVGCIRKLCPYVTVMADEALIRAAVRECGEPCKNIIIKKP